MESEDDISESLTDFSNISAGEIAAPTDVKNLKYVEVFEICNGIPKVLTNNFGSWSSLILICIFQIRGMWPPLMLIHYFKITLFLCHTSPLVHSLM